MAIDLGIVIPTYNEEECIVKVLESWISMLTDLGMSFHIIVLNDGSSDGTGQALQIFKHDNRVEVIHKANSGHGPTILMGYKKSVKLADWTFQCDSDNEMKPDSFRILWENRERFDALFGIRVERDQSFARKIISSFSRFIIRLLFGNGVTDVNTPYRLIRSQVLERVVRYIPVNAFAPNVIISGIISKFGLRIFEHPVFHENRVTGKVSIVKWKLWKSAIKAFWQTLCCWIAVRNIDYQSA